uniref:Fibulin 5 n=1 Tax=Eptatretus burgeri TaxID=7764 RepID=A0A8C4WZL3_EPTBU
MHTFLALVMLLLAPSLCLSQVPHHAQCMEGYTWDAQQRNCKDINECESIPEACKGDMKCVNHNAGYLCLPKTATFLVTDRWNNPGERRDTVPSRPSTGRIYRPSNPHSSTSSSSRGSSSSTSIDRTSTLRRRPTFTPSRSRTRTSGRLPWSHGGTDSSRSPCPLGYVLDSRNQCMDLDECAIGTYRCPHAQSCINTVGSYTCSCPDGFHMVEGNCEDTDECSMEGTCSQQCTNTYGSFACRCETGYALDLDGRTCQDVDECNYSERQHQCQHNCFNEPGSFTCVCPNGYSLQPDGRSCRDVDECKGQSHNCSDDERCYNVFGGNKCLERLQCEEPYTQTGEDRCICPNEKTTCINKPYTTMRMYMHLRSERNTPSDIFQMQATTRYPGAFYTFFIRAGNDNREFLMRPMGASSAMLVLVKPIVGPREIVLDLEMITVNPSLNYHGTSVIQLWIFVSAFPF